MSDDPELLAALRTVAKLSERLNYAVNDVARREERIVALVAERDRLATLVDQIVDAWDSGGEWVRGEFEVLMDIARASRLPLPAAPEEPQ